MAIASFEIDSTRNSTATLPNRISPCKNPRCAARIAPYVKTGVKYKRDCWSVIWKKLLSAGMDKNHTTETASAISTEVFMVCLKKFAAREPCFVATRYAVV